MDSNEIKNNEDLVATSVDQLIAYLQSISAEKPVLRVLGQLSLDQQEKVAPYLPTPNSGKSISVLGRLLGKAAAKPAEGAVMVGVFYAETGPDVERILEGLASRCDGIVILDQIDNVEGVHSEVFHLHDMDGRPYDATCHPFGRILKQLGFVHVTTLAAPQKTKSLTGALIAFRTPFGGLRPDRSSV